MNSYLDSIIELAIREDIGEGDHTSLSCCPANLKGKTELIVKEEGILAGLEVARYIIKKFDEDARITFLMKEGDQIKPGDIAFVAKAKILAILQAERLVLNIMQRMSGIATQTAKYVEKLKGYKTHVLDTRKTSPGMRFLEKEAVRIGGGINHRFGLFDMILLKDNHIDFAGGIENAIKQAQEYLNKNGKKLRIEVETRSLEDIKKVMKIGGVDIIMLDNFSIEDTKKAVELIQGKYEIESSGSITIDNLTDYAACGVDYISVGALTHQVKSIDMSLKAVIQK